MSNLSDKLGGLTFTPRPQSPLKAGAIFDVASDDVTAWEQQNWFKCDGSEYAEADYAQLFSVLGTKYNTGGETASHFRVPNGPYKTDTITSLSYSATPAGWVDNGSYGFCYCDTKGQWWFSFAISAGTSGGTNRALTFSGITWKKNLIGISVYLSSIAGSAQLTSSSDITVFSASSNSDFRVSGNVPINAKPTDAFVGADSRFSTFDEALEYQPMIKVYDDASNISMSIADATESLTGAVRLSSDFAAGDGVYGFVQKWSEVVDITGDANFSVGNLVFSRVDNVVTVTADQNITHSSSTGGVISSAAGLIPAEFRPSDSIHNCYYVTTDETSAIRVNTDGSFGLRYFSSTGGVARTTTRSAPIASYVIT